MSDFLFIAGIIVAEAAVMWCMYGIGFDEGFDRGWKAGRTDGWLKAAEFYRDVLDKLWERIREAEK